MSETDTVERAPCAKCDEPISVNAEKCPECGNHPKAASKKTVFVISAASVIGGIFWAPFLLGVLLAVAMIIGGRWSDERPTEHAWG